MSRKSSATDIGLDRAIDVGVTVGLKTVSNRFDELVVETYNKAIELLRVSARSNITNQSIKDKQSELESFCNLLDESYDTWVKKHYSIYDKELCYYHIREISRLTEELNEMIKNWTEKQTSDNIPSLSE